MFQFLFKYPASAFERGKLVLLGPWPEWLLPLAIVAGFLLLGLVIWKLHGRFSKSITSPRAIALWLLQSATVAILLLLLWQPAISITSLRPQQNIVAVLIDDSASMAVADEGDSREKEAVQLLQSKLLAKLTAKYQVRLYRLDAGITRLDDVAHLKPDASATQIGTALHELSQETATLPIGAVVLLSDGSDNSGGIDLATLNEIKGRRLPINTIGFGKDRLSHDVELDDFVVPPKVLVNARVEAQVRVHQHDFIGKQCHLIIMADGSPVATRNITLKDTAEQVESIEFAAGKSGVRRLEARLEPLPGEENTKNNSQVRVMAVDGAKRRLLYVEGEPRWEYKFLRRAVEDDPAVEIVSMLRTTQNKIYRQGIADPSELVDGFPTKAEELFQYQGLILGSVESGFFTPEQQHMISDFVDRRGGGLLFLGGHSSLSEGDYNAPPFAQLLPVVLPKRKNTFHRDLVVAELTEAGKNSLVCRIEEARDDSVNHWNILPYLADYQEVGTLKPGAVELAQVVVGSNKYPLLVTENYGRGRTAVFATGGSWRWKMQQPTADSSQQTFWRQLVRWTAGETPGPIVASVSSSQLEDSGKLTIRANVRNKTYNPSGAAKVEAVVITPAGGSQSVSMHADPSAQGSYSAEFNAAQTGSYLAEVKASENEVDLTTDVVAFQRENGAAEYFHRQQNRELLQRLAENTGGHYYTKSTAMKLPDEISFSESGVTARETLDLWNMPIVFFLLLTLRSAEWLLRRRWGVV